jgi:hypothetical protein
MMVSDIFYPHGETTASVGKAFVTDVLTHAERKYSDWNRFDSYGQQAVVTSSYLFSLDMTEPTNNASS